jgi:hypothetical protein
VLTSIITTPVFIGVMCPLCIQRWSYNTPSACLSESCLKSTSMVRSLPFQDMQVPSPGFGAMGLSHGLGSNFSLEEAEPVLSKAIELGCTFWDTAVLYQAGVNEKLLGDFIRKHNVRDKVFSKYHTSSYPAYGFLVVQSAYL